MLERSEYTLRPEAAWVEFVNDPVRSRVLPSQEVYDLCCDAQASRVVGLVGDPGPSRGWNGRRAYSEWLRQRPCACGRPECKKSVESVLYHCGLCDEARALLRRGMATFACGLPHAPPLDKAGQPIMGRKHAQRMGRQVHLRVLGMFNAAESGREEASAARRYFPRPVAAVGGPRWWRGARPGGAARTTPAPAAEVRKLLSLADVGAAVRHYGPYDLQRPRVGFAWTWEVLETLSDKRNYAAVELCRTCLLKLRLHCLQAGPAANARLGSAGSWGASCWLSSRRLDRRRGRFISSTSSAPTLPRC